MLIYPQIDGVRGDRYTMTEAHAMSRSTGQGLLTLGADKGDTVAVILPNMPEWVPVSYYYYHYYYHYHC